MKRIKTKGVIDKRFFCPFCKEDIRVVGLGFQEEALQDVSADYNEDGNWNNNNYGDICDSNFIENSVECGNCEHRLFGIDPYEDLNLTNLWE